MRVDIRRPDLEQFVDEKVRAGEYPSAEAVVESALEIFRAGELEFPSGEELRRLIAEGQAASDRGETRDGEEVFRELLHKNAQRQRNS